MKITKRQLRRIIQESILQEQASITLYDDGVAAVKNNSNVIEVMFNGRLVASGSFNQAANSFLMTASQSAWEQMDAMNKSARPQKFNDVVDIVQYYTGDANPGAKVDFMGDARHEY